MTGPSPAKGTRVRFLFLAFFLLAMLAVPESALAGKGVFRKTTEPTTGVFDFCVSIRFNATTQEISRIQEVFQLANKFLADATDGQHHFGKISLINNSMASEEAEIWIWPSGARAGATTGGYGLRGQHINLFYNTEFFQPNTIRDALIVVHEFAHHAYGVLDEYYSKRIYHADGSEPDEVRAWCPTKATWTNPTLNYCLMDDVTRGARITSTTYSVNEFCVASNHDKPEPDNTGGYDTSQSLGHNNESCWQTMAHLETKWRLQLPANGLPEDAPPASVPDVVFDTTCSAQTQRVVILIDRSGSMNIDQRLQLSQDALNSFIDFFAQGESLGIVSFSTTASVNFPLTQINDSVARNNAKAAVRSLTAGGATNIGEGLTTALSLLNGQSACSGCDKTIILLSDGDNNVGFPPESVITSLQNSNVNVVPITLGYNISIPGEITLKNIANQTGGKYFRVQNQDGAVVRRLTNERLRNLALGLQAFKGVSYAPQFISSGQVREVPVLVEVGAATTDFGVEISDQMDNVTLSLRKPSGVVLTEKNGPNVEFTIQPYSRFFKVTAPEPGVWTIVVTAGSIRSGGMDVFAYTKHDGTELFAWVDNDTVYSTESVKVHASPTFEGRSIVGSSLTGTVVRPDGSEVPITLYDDGSQSSGDNAAGDGVYTALFNSYNNDGTYTFNLKYENVGGKYYAGERFPAEEGPVQDLPQPTVTNATRITSVTAIVSGLTAGDMVWFDDALPRGAAPSANWDWIDNEPWEWVSSNPGPLMGAAAHQSKITTDISQHAFDGATAKLPVNVGDSLFTYVFLDPNNMPKQIMLQWNDGSWEHRAYWGANILNAGANGTPAYRYMGALPVAAQWVRLEVPASLVGLEGKAVNGMAFTLYGGRATWDRSGKTNQPTTDPTDSPDFVWVDDAIPQGAKPDVVDDVWNWVSTNPPPASGSLSHKTYLGNSGDPVRFRSHSFSAAQTPMAVSPGDVLFASVYLDPTYTPDEIMLQWNDGDGWEHRAYWGANFIGLGVTGTESRRYMGGLPPVGGWYRLEVPASYVGLEGKSVSGMAFGVYRDRARPLVTWDRAGKARQVTTPPIPWTAMTPFYRLYGTDYGGYYYYSTVDIGRADQTVQRIQFYIFPNQAAGTVPLYRFRDTGLRYFYTTNRNGPQPPVWQYETIAGYVYPDASVSGTVPLYLFRHSTYGYFYTTVYSEGAGMNYEGISCYVNDTNPLAPAAPAPAYVFPDSSTTISLNWRDNSLNETGFKIERREPGGTAWNQIMSVGANTVKYVMPVAQGYMPCFRVRAINAVGYSAYSNVTCRQTIYVMPGTQPSAPEISIASPANNAVVGPSFTVRTNAFDDDGYVTIARVELFEGSNKLGEATEAPYSITVDGAAAGTHALTAVVTDNTGATGTSTPVTVVVNGPPAVSITAPLNSATFTAGSNITINASATDVGGSVSKVEFFKGSSKLGESLSAPYSFVWSGVPAGTYSLTAKATDNSGTTTTSGVVTVNVSASAGAAESRSLSLNGTDAYMEVPYDVTANDSLDITGPLTLEAWIKYNSSGSYQTIVAKESHLQTGAGGGYELQLTDTGKVRMTIWTSPTAYAAVIGATTVSPGVWHHVAAVADNGQRRVYLDGVLDATVTGTLVPASGTAELEIGRRSNNTYRFNGLIDEVRVSAGALYNTEFTPEVSLDAMPGVTRGLWKFNGQSDGDSSGNGNDGTLQGGAAYSTDVALASRYSLSLNGSNAYVQVPYDAATNTSLDVAGEITLEAWVNYNSTGLNQTIVARESANIASGGGGYELAITDTGKVRMNIWTSPTAYAAVIGATTLSPGVWHHVATVSDGNGRRVYLDGQLDASVTGSYLPTSGTAGLKIGRRSSSSKYYFNGLIDEVRVSAGAVYTADFVPQANLGTTVNTTRGLWKFNQQDVSDTSLNNNTGTLQGGAAYSTDVALASRYSLSLNGANAWVEAPYSTSLDIAGPITIEAWVKYDSIGLYQTIVAKESANQTGGGGGYELSLNNEGKVRLNIWTSPTSYGMLISETTLSPGVWHHVAAVADGTERRIYLDGLLDVSVADNLVPTAGSGELKIGRRSSSNLYRFKGFIDEVRISNSALYSADFFPTASLTKGPSTKGLWRFNQLTADDTSGNGNDGQTIGGAAYSTNVP